MNTESPDLRPEGPDESKDFRSVPEGIILERFKRMQMLPPHIRNLQDEFFVQSFLRRKRHVI